MDPAWIVLLLVVTSLVFFATEALRYEVVAVLVVLGLIVTGCLDYREAFASFAAPAPVMVASMYVFARGVERWGLGEAFGRACFRAESESGLTLRVVLGAGLLSTVISDTAVTAAMLPVVSATARRARLPVSKLLIPLSFGSLLGGMVTVLGTSANIALNDVLVTLEVRPFGLFEYAPAGLLMLALGLLYFLTVGRRLLPSARLEESLSEHYQVPRFLTEVLVEPTSGLIHKAPGELDVLARSGVTLVGILRSRGADPLLVPGPYDRIRGDDVLLLQGEPESIVRVREELGLTLRASAGRAAARLVSSDVQLVEAVVPAGSPLVGRTLAAAEFRAESGLNVLGLSQRGHHRRHGAGGPGGIGGVGRAPLAVGDTLLLQGHLADLERERRRGRLLVLGEVETPPAGHGRALLLSVLGAVLLVSTLGWFPLAVCAFAGAVALVLLGCLRAKDALAGIDWSVILLVGGLLALGTAFERHGLGERCAEFLLLQPQLAASPSLALVALLATTLVLTQVTTNVSTVVIMTPVAVALAARLEVDPRPLLVTVALGASCAFLTPMGHAANTMVTGPGGYRFRDFVRVGAPLTLLLGVAIAVVVPLLFPF